MRRLARCILAALLASSFAAPVLANPPPVKAPVVQVTIRAAEPWVVSISASVPGQGWNMPNPMPSPIPNVADAQAYALDQLGAMQYACLDSIIQGESRWRPYVWNTKGSGAFGLGQAKPASKMAPYGDDYMTSPLTQVKFVIGYTAKKYGSACNAARYRATHGSY